MKISSIENYHQLFQNKEFMNNSELNKKTYIKNITKEELKYSLNESGFQTYRAEQILDEIYIRRTESFEKMELLPQKLRNFLDNNFTLNSLKLKKMRRSTDSSIKFLFDLHDGKSIESVYMPWYDENFEDTSRITLCISSMAGCPVECAFCATGTMGLLRNLEPAEIVDQILMVEKETQKKVTNIVFMGMGEPLLNLKNVKSAILILTDENNSLISRKRITVSSVGFPSRIKELSETGIKVKLAISLHATTNGLRHKLIPFLKNIDINELMDSIEDYYRVTKIPITYEYIMFDGLNDTDEDAKRLIKIARRVPSKVNIIPFNDISFTNPSGFAAELKPTPRERIEEFAKVLKSERIPVIIRDTFGSDIEAACGQLALS